jgi:alkylhydroperoxidase/carboxymuconolactone decarboxylase family protein YurZ
MGSETRIAEALEQLQAAADPSHDVKSADAGPLDRRTRALVGIGAAVSLGASTSTYRPLVEEARQGGATPGDCVGAFVAAAPIAGSVRVVTGAPRLASALGYDVGAALE